MFNSKNKMNYKEQKEIVQNTLHRPIFTSTLIGVIPSKSSTNKFTRIINKFYSILNPLVVCIVTYQMCSDLFQSQEEEITVFIEIIMNAGVHVTAAMALILYRYKVNSLQNLLDCAYENFRFHSQYSDEDVVSMIPLLKKVNFILPYFIIFTYASSYQWLVVPLMFSGDDGGRLLPVEGNFPYRAHDTPYYELTYFLQAYSFTCLAFIYSHINSTFTTLTILACKQYDILCCNIRNSANGDTSLESIFIPTYNNISKLDQEDTTKSKTNISISHDMADRNTLLAISDCVEYHQKLREFCQGVQEYFNQMFSVQLIMLIITIGAALFSFLQKFAMNTAQFTIVSVTFLAILCFQGQQILHKSGNIHEAVWASRWTERSIKVRKAYIILMQQGLHPTRLVVCGLFQLNLDNFIMFLKTVFSFFTLLRNIIDKPQ